MKALERYLSHVILNRPPRRTRTTRKRGLLALCLDYVKFPDRDRAYKSWIRTLPCSIPDCTRYKVEAAHTGSDGGAKLKASDRSCVPLCRIHHQEYHGLNGGKLAVERRYLIDFRAIVARLNTAYEKEKTCRK